MRVLVVHNKYSSRVPSGENLAVQDEVDWLRRAGVDVHVHQVSNDDILAAGLGRRARQAAATVWSLPALRHLTASIDRLGPDVVHVHNLFPLLSASTPWAAVRRRVPVVWTVHNRRVVCVIGTNFRAGQPCHQCRPGWRLPGIRHACYAGSVGASALTTASTSVFRAVARRRITPVAISEHVKRWLATTAGFDPRRVRVKYNGVSDPAAGRATAQTAGPTGCRTFLFAGYLIDYKGVSLLLDAWRRAGDVDAELRIVGDGPLTDDVRAAAAHDPRISWEPRVPGNAMPDLLRSARAVLVPSTWDEPFGRIAAEAAAHGRPVITTGTGGLAEIVTEETGWTTGLTSDAFAQAMREAASSDELVASRGMAGRRRYERLLSPEATTRRLVSIYEDVLAESHVQQPGPAR